MKVLKTSIVGILITLYPLYSFSQNELPVSQPNHNKPLLFAEMPETIKLNISNLEALLELPVGEGTHTHFGDNFDFQGIVVSTSPAQSDVKSVVVKSTNKKGATLTLTKIILADGTIKFLGRIISLKNGDAFEIIKTGDEYILQKQATDDVITE